MQIKFPVGLLPAPSQPGLLVFPMLFVSRKWQLIPLKRKKKKQGETKEDIITAGNKIVKAEMGELSKSNSMDPTTEDISQWPLFSKREHSLNMPGYFTMCLHLLFFFSVFHVTVNEFCDFPYILFLNVPCNFE